MEKDEIKKILVLAERFTKETLGKKDPKDKCFSISYPLSIHLENNGFKNLITQGFFNDTPHYWLTIENDRNLIIDPTIKQFHKEGPPVFIGYKSNKYCYIADENTLTDWIDDVYKRWIEPFDKPDESSKIDVDIFLEINIKAAILIYNELEEMKIDINNSEKCKIYFNGIFEILKNCDIKLKKFEKVRGFKNLKLYVTY